MKRRLAFVLFLLVGLMFSSPSWNGQAETGIIFAPDQQPDRGTPPPLFFERKVATPDEARDYAAPAATPGEEAQPEEQMSPAELREIYESEAFGAIRSGERILIRGLEGEDVRLVQARLLALGYDVGEPDGVYGRRTIRAVERFQEKNQLEKVDGNSDSTGSSSSMVIAAVIVVVILLTGLLMLLRRKSKTEE